MSKGRRGFNLLRDTPLVIWLAATVVVAVVHQELAAPRWLMIHLLLLGAVSHSIVVWSQHFADALLKTRPPSHAIAGIEARIVGLNVAVLLVLIGVVGEAWPLTVAGAGALILVVAAHGALLVAQLRRSLPARFAATVRFYVAAAALLTVGTAAGAILARGASGALHERLHVAHIALNVMGWIGLTVLGTLITLWPTILGARIEQAAAATAMRALPVLVSGPVLVTFGAAVDQRWWVTLGLAATLVGLAMVARALLANARSRPPITFASLSIAAGVIWWVACLAVLLVGSVTAPTWASLGARVDDVAPLLAAGFAGQVLLGALSYLVPTVLGGGPTSSRASHREFDRGASLRIVTTNAGLVVLALPVPAAVRLAALILVLASLTAFLVLLVRATRQWILSKRTEVEAWPAPLPAPAVHSPWHERPRGQRVGLAAVGLAIAVVVVAVGVAVDPAPVISAASEGALDEGTAPTGRTVEATIVADGMRFTPDVIEVNAGDRLVITLKNTDTTTVHDLVFDSGAGTARLSPGATEVLDLGVVGRSAQGWCSVVGHRAMGMTLSIEVSGDPAPPAMDDTMMDPDHDGAPGVLAQDSGAAGLLDFLATPGSDFAPWDAALAPASDSTIHRETFTVMEVEREVAPGVTQTLWTFNGAAPGPVLRGRVGDTFEITLVNGGSMGHSIDFHAGSLAPDEVMRTIAPGESLTYTFTANRAGIWMYHCSTMPMSAHIANGMFGAVIIDPPGLPSVDREYVIVQSEYYLGQQGGVVDFEKVRSERPDAVVFNGYANQYDAAPLAAEVGERVRVWVLNAGPNRGTSFHVVGSQFDAVYAEGSYLLPRGTTGGSQVLGLAVAQGGFVELTFPEAGNYPFVSHVMVDAERGAHGLFEVTGTT